MGILAVGRISESFGRRLTGVLVCGRLRLMSSGSNVINSDEKLDVKPWLMRRPAKPKGSDGKTMYRLYSVEEKKKQVFEEIAGELQPNTSSRIVGSSHGWLAFFNYSNGSLFLTNPCSGGHIELPSLATLPDSDNWASRMIISDGVDECRALMIYGPYQSLAFCVPGRSDEWSPIDDGPNNLEALSRKYENMVYSRRRKLFFCIKQVIYKYPDTALKRRQPLYTTTALESWDLRDPHSPRLTWSLGPNVDSLDFDVGHYRWRDAASKEEEILKRFYCLHFKYLVMDEASDQLFLVVRHIIPRMGRNASIARIIYHGHYGVFDGSYPHKTIDFDVYKIDLENNNNNNNNNNNTVVSHVNAASLGGLALFLGINHPVAVRPRPGGSGLKPNSIYFTDLTEHVPLYHRGGHDNGVFDYENRTFSSLPYSKAFQYTRPRKIHTRGPLYPTASVVHPLLML